MTTAIIVASLPIISVLIPRAMDYAKSRSKATGQSGSNNNSGLRKAFNPFRHGDDASKFNDSIPLSDASTKAEDDKSNLQPTIRHKVEQYGYDLEAPDDFGRYDDSQDSIRPAHDARHGGSYGQAS